MNDDANDGPQGQASFSQLLRRFRQRAGLTQEELAERAELSAGYIGRLERNERKARGATVNQLVQALELADEQRSELLDAAESAPTALGRTLSVIDWVKNRHRRAAIWSKIRTASRAISFQFGPPDPGGGPYVERHNVREGLDGFLSAKNVPCCGLVGELGSGKSTEMSMIARSWTAPDEDLCVMTWNSSDVERVMRTRPELDLLEVVGRELLHHLIHDGLQSGAWEGGQQELEDLLRERTLVLVIEHLEDCLDPPRIVELAVTTGARAAGAGLKVKIVLVCRTESWYAATREVCSNHTLF